MRTPQPRQLADGSTAWIVRYRREGRQRTLTARGPDAKAQADEFARLLDLLGADRAVMWWNAQADEGLPVGGLTLDGWFPRYLASLTGLTDGTRLTYDRVYHRVWSKPLGHMPLASITREDVARVVNELSARRSDKTVRNAFGVLSSAFNVAQRDGHAPANPCTGMRLPRRTEHTATEMRFLTYGEWAVLYDELPPHYRPLFTLLVGTGMRWGEAEALTVADVVLEPMPIVRISKAAKWNASKAAREVGPTKTRRSKRTVTLPPEVVDELGPLLDRPGGQRLFLAPRGGPIRHRTVYDDWKAAVQRARLDPQPRIHDLRHTHVAWLIAQRITLPVIQSRLGHEHISTTIDRYGHLLPDLQIEAAQAASVAMRPISPRAALAVPPAAEPEPTD